MPGSNVARRDRTVDRDEGHEAGSAFVFTPPYVGPLIVPHSLLRRVTRNAMGHEPMRVTVRHQRTESSARSDEFLSSARGPRAQLGQTVDAMSLCPIGTYGSGFATPANRSPIQWIMSEAEGPITPAWL